MARADHVVQLRKGVLELAILALLRDEARYGGEIVTDLAARRGLDASPGTVYPLLTRLRLADLLSTTWQESPVGPPRKYYSLTSAGRKALSAMAESWRELSQAVDELLETIS
jgi:PadR family transcriptional regulator PadR